jgi:competence protein ComEA
MTMDSGDLNQMNSIKYITMVLVLSAAFILTGSYEQARAEDEIVSFNTATVEEFLAIEDVDIPESLAKSIVAYRKKNGRFKDPMDLRKVPGMSDAFFEDLNPVLSEDEKDVVYDPDAEPALAPSKC